MPSETGIASDSLDLVNIDPTAIYSVTELSQNIKQALSTNPQFNDILLKGEISNFARAASGHIYFNLKDENCVIACALFRHLQETSCNDLGDGIQVVAMGSVTAYEPRSQYQLTIKISYMMEIAILLQTFQ
jgi:exodeoxyribonuclease VII large subunit